MAELGGFCVVLKLALLVDASRNSSDPVREYIFRQRQPIDGVNVCHAADVAV